MKLSKNSKKLMSFFTNNYYIKPVSPNKETEETIRILHNDILKAFNYVNHIKQRGEYYDVSIKKIKNSSQITRPKIFDSSSFPEIVRGHIDELATFEITYSFSLYGRKIKLHFIVEDEKINKTQQDVYDKYVDSIAIWLFILNKYASEKCSKIFTVYFYFTSLEKKLPKSNIYILDQIHVNTAFTTTCPQNSEIVIFRKEEWFKVFIHETFHNFALDFSDMDNTYVTNCVLNMFNVSSDVNLFESYTEVWAEMINAMFCSFFSLKDKTNVDQFLSSSLFYINFERSFSFFQMVKVLDFMGLSYNDLYSNTNASKIARKQLYKEKTNVLAYYVIKTVLLNNYSGFLSWCKINNHSLLMFNKTPKSQYDFCKFIEKNYKSTRMIHNVVETERMYDDLQNKKITNLNYLLSSLRMSVCDLG